MAPALSETTAALDISELDDELAAYVPKRGLSRVARFGLRGEVVFPVPSVLVARPGLLAYYRLLYGVSQKEFYNKGPFGLFREMESGKLTDRAAEAMPALCRSLVRTGVQLAEALEPISTAMVHELQLLTLGPQLRGGWNTRRGQAATSRVFALVRELAGAYVTESSASHLMILNDSQRSIRVAFASDPDIAITEQAPSGVLPLVSVEIKGGTDRSNIHNRLGEAEKSHRKAKAEGFFEFWTIVGVSVERPLAERESPTTTHFFDLEQIADVSSGEHAEFRDVLASKIGIRVSSGGA